MQINSAENVEKWMNRLCVCVRVHVCMYVCAFVTMYIPMITKCESRNRRIPLTQTAVCCPSLSEASNSNELRLSDYIFTDDPKFAAIAALIIGGHNCGQCNIIHLTFAVAGDAPGIRFSEKWSKRRDLPVFPLIKGNHDKKRWATVWCQIVGHLMQ